MKQLYKGFTLFVNNTHFGIEHVVKGNTTYHRNERPLVEGFTTQQYIDFLKFELDVEEEVATLQGINLDCKSDVYRIGT